MRRQNTPPAEQYRLVMECRQSGMSDSLWCKEHGILPSTFYNWVTRLRKKGCEISAPINKDEFLPLPYQDVVKVNLVPDIPFIDEAKPEPIPANAFSGLRLELGGAKLEISNDVNLELLVSVLHFLRGATC